MEAVLLPAPEIKQLCEKVHVAALRRADPACAALRKEFNVPYLNSYVIVLDGQGETLGLFMGDTAGQGCTKETCDKFPGLLTAKIEEYLKRTESVQELQRRFDKAPADLQAFEALAARYDDMNARGLLYKLCERTAAATDLPKEKRDEIRIRGYLARSRDASTHETSETKAKFADDGLRLIVELAENPKADSIVDALFTFGYQGCFDVPQKSAAGIEKLRLLRQDRQAVAKLIDKLVSLRQDWIKRTETVVKNPPGSNPEFTRAYNWALLGNAENTIRFFGQAPYDKTAYYQSWVKAAREKLEQEY